MGWHGLDCIHLIYNVDNWYAFVETGMNFRGSYNATNFVTT
jgi:hypothetical protein